MGWMRMRQGMMASKEAEAETDPWDEASLRGRRVEEMASIGRPNVA